MCPQNRGTSIQLRTNCRLWTVIEVMLVLSTVLCTSGIVAFHVISAL